MTVSFPGSLAPGGGKMRNPGNEVGAMKKLSHCLLHLVSWHGTVIHLSAFCLIRMLSSVQNVFAVSFQGRAKVSSKKIIVRKIEIFRKFWDI